MTRIIWGLWVLVLAGCGASVSVDSSDEGVVFTNRIVALGDSLTEGYQLPREESYPAQLQQKLRDEGFGHYEVINSGISGEITVGTLRRVDFIIGLEPDMVILEIGANDALRGLNLENTRENLEKIITQLQGAGVVVVLAGMDITENLGASYVSRFRGLYPDLARRYDLPFIPEFLAGVSGSLDLNLPDRIHPNAEGYKIVVEKNVWPVLRSLLD